MNPKMYLKVAFWTIYTHTHTHKTFCSCLINEAQCVLRYKQLGYDFNPLGSKVFFGVLETF